MYVHTLVGAGGTANGSLVDEKSGIRYQPQPEDGAAQQSPNMVESLTAQQSSVAAQQSHKTNKMVESLTAQQSSVAAQQSHKTNPSVGMVESLTAQQSRMLALLVDRPFFTFPSSIMRKLLRRRWRQ